LANATPASDKGSSQAPVAYTVEAPMQKLALALVQIVFVVVAIAHGA